MNARQPISLRPDRDAIAEMAVASLVCAVLDSARRSLDRNAQDEYADDRGSRLILRGATAPTTRADAHVLATIAVSFFASLVGVSAAAALISRSPKLSFDGAALIGIPSLTLPHAAFIAEGAPIPVTQGTSAPGTVLEPFKLATIITLTGEMVRNSNAEVLIRQVLAENVGPTLDAAMLSAAAAVPGVRPAGILNGIAAIAPGASMVKDVQALATAIAPVAGNGQVVLIAAPAQAVNLVMGTPREVFPVLVSSVLAAGTVIAIATQGLATVIDAPTIETSQDAVTHMFDPAAPISDTGGLASPVASVFQTDSVSLKFRQPVAWTLRSPSAVAWLSGATW